MTALATVDPATAGPAVKPLLDAVVQKLGVVPNLMRLLATNPAVLHAYLSYTGALEGGRLGPATHSQIALAVAETNGSQYCLAAHATLGKGAGLDSDAIDRARGGQAADPRVAAALAFARKLVDARSRVTARDVQALRAAKLDDADILEIVAAVAINIFTNYINATAETDIDFPQLECRSAA